MAMRQSARYLTAAVREARAVDRVGVRGGEQAIGGRDARSGRDRLADQGASGIGAITYSFRAITDADAIVKAMAAIGLGEAELMSNHAEALAGAPGGRGDRRGLDAWRQSTSPETWKRVRGEVRGRQGSSCVCSVTT